jgi:hypothetical protein
VWASIVFGKALDGAISCALSQTTSSEGVPPVDRQSTEKITVNVACPLLSFEIGLPCTKTLEKKWTRY